MVGSEAGLLVALLRCSPRFLDVAFATAPVPPVLSLPALPATNPEHSCRGPPPDSGNQPVSNQSNATDASSPPMYLVLR